MNITYVNTGSLRIETSKFVRQRQFGLANPCRPKGGSPADVKRLSNNRCNKIDEIYIRSVCITAIILGLWNQVLSSLSIITYRKTPACVGIFFSRKNLLIDKKWTTRPKFWCGVMLSILFVELFCFWYVAFLEHLLGEAAAMHLNKKIARKTSASHESLLPNLYIAIE